MNRYALCTSGQIYLTITFEKTIFIIQSKIRVLVYFLYKRTRKINFKNSYNFKYENITIRNFNKLQTERFCSTYMIHIVSPLTFMLEGFQIFHLVELGLGDVPGLADNLPDLLGEDLLLDRVGGQVVQQERHLVPRSINSRHQRVHRHHQRYLRVRTASLLMGQFMKAKVAEY
jgi:hypothetical protein